MKEIDQAFPIETDDAYHLGLTKLDYFAAKAMEAIILSKINNSILDKTTIAMMAYEFAKAMMEERQK